MKINTALTPESVETLSKWTDDDSSLIKANIESLEAIKNFLILQWGDLQTDDCDSEIKSYLVDICYLQADLKCFVQKGDNS